MIIVTFTTQLHADVKRIANRRQCTDVWVFREQCKPATNGLRLHRTCIEIPLVTSHLVQLG